MRRSSAEQLVEHWQLTTMPTENVPFCQTYVDPRTGPDSKPPLLGDHRAARRRSDGVF
jgi:hypothetical protein